eukprot:TRINITY_DN66880_c2_g1_i1.p1 TRINITY_DN66880_c2_g1~~TRINITY_DN66880_c2_g1_i1.p1  ORF type:complete len:377 (-),score=199.53 TRINITY_DN66880_c2_g1_i1:37-1167(-)
MGCAWSLLSRWCLRRQYDPVAGAEDSGDDGLGDFEDWDDDDAAVSAQKDLELGALLPKESVSNAAGKRKVKVDESTSLMRDNDRDGGGGGAQQSQADLPRQSPRAEELVKRPQSSNSNHGSLAAGSVAVGLTSAGPAPIRPVRGAVSRLEAVAAANAAAAAASDAVVGSTAATDTSSPVHALPKPPAALRKPQQQQQQQQKQKQQQQQHKQQQQQHDLQSPKKSAFRRPQPQRVISKRLAEATGGAATTPGGKTTMSASSTPVAGGVQQGGAEPALDFFADMAPAIKEPIRKKVYTAPTSGSKRTHTLPPVTIAQTATAAEETTDSASTSSLSSSLYALDSLLDDGAGDGAGEDDVEVDVSAWGGVDDDLGLGLVD